MKRRISAVFLALCLTLTLCSPVLTGAAKATDADFTHQSLEELLNEYFQTVLTRGIAEYDCDYEDFLTWMSETVLENAIIRVESLNEQEKTVTQVSFSVTDRNEETGALTADVTEIVDGQSFTTTHRLRVSEGQGGGGWFIESDNYFDAVLYPPGSEDASGRPNVGASVTPSQSHQHSYKNTGDQAQDIVNIALTQEGYAETGNNYTKYNFWYYNNSNVSAAWCAIFISWCANQAGIETSIIRKNALASGYSVKNMSRNSFKTARAYAFGDTTPRPGDIAYIDNNNDNISNHVGLVYKADSSYVYTIEGNFSNKVAKRKYSASNGRISGSSTRIVFLARPAYRGGTDTPTPTGPSTLSIRPAQETYRITEGASCNIAGEISSNYPLTTVSASFDNVDWSARIENVGTTYLNIENSDLNSFRGSALPAGTHTLTIHASDTSGNAVKKSISIVVSPGMRITFSPASLTLNVGETKTLSVEYVAAANAKSIAWDSAAFHIVSFSEASQSVSTGNVWQLSVYGNQEGTENIPFRLLDASGRELCTDSLPVTVNRAQSGGQTPGDVPESAYYYASVLWAIGNGVIVRFAQNFQPSTPCTRASAVTFLWRLAGAPMPSSSHNPFTDVVPTDSYYNAALWAVERGITNGTSADKFSPAATCNRGQIVTFLHRYAGQPAASGVNRFSDVPQGSFCYDSVNWAASNGITEGFGDNTFRPKEPCTRAHIITFIYRYAIMR